MTVSHEVQAGLCLFGERQFRHAILGGPNGVVGFLALIPLSNGAPQELMLRVVANPRVTAVIAQNQFHVSLLDVLRRHGFRQNAPPEAAVKQLLDGPAAALAVVERPVVNVHGNKAVGGSGVQTA